MRGSLKTIVLVIVLITLVGVNSRRFLRNDSGLGNLANGGTRRLQVNNDGGASITLKRGENWIQELLQFQSYIQLKTENHARAQSYLQFPATITRTQEGDDSESVIELPQYDIPKSGYTGMLSVGTPPQELPCIFDTGSSVLWINSDTCTMDNCEKNPQYIHESSSTYKEDGQLVELTYGGGFLKGQLIDETVTLGHLHIPHQTIGSVTEEDKGSTDNFS